MPAGSDAPRSAIVELASRLSFFLWSSIPDDELLELGRSTGSCASRACSRRRCGACSRTRAPTRWSRTSSGQWLQLRNLEKRVKPDFLLFPDFDDNLRKAFRRETELLFANVLREGRRVHELLNANYTFVNERLARHYGIPGVYGARFRRVDAHGSEPLRLVRPRQLAGADVGGEPHVADHSRQVHR